MRCISRYVLAGVTLALFLGCGSEPKIRPSPSNDEAPGDGDGDGDGDGSGDGGGPSCRPTRAQFAAVKPLFEEWCGTCHGEAPKFGAPFSLVDYDTVIGRHGTDYIVDLVASQLSLGNMPPADQPQPSASAYHQLLGFATCDSSHTEDGEDGGMEHTTDGGTHHPGGGGLETTREPLVADDTPPAGATQKDLTASEFELAPDDLDNYQTFTFKNVVTTDQFIRRFDPVLDEESVVHHLTMRFSGSQGFLYAWGPGGHPIEFPEGGVRVKPSDTIKLEIHYNNGIGASDIKDSSGVRLWLAEPVGSEYGLANLASWGIYVPAGTTSSATATCNVQNAAHIFAAAPHMHGIGDSFSHTIDRASGPDDEIVSLTGWAFGVQVYYSVGVDVAPGDKLNLKCTYVNDTDNDVMAGPNTNDEMCFDFMYVTPPKALANCADPITLP